MREMLTADSIQAYLLFENEVADAYAAGVPIEIMRERFNISRRSITAIADRHGIPRRNPGYAPRCR